MNEVHTFFNPTEEAPPSGKLPEVRVGVGPAPAFQTGSIIRQESPDGLIEYEFFNIVDEYHISLKTPTIPWDFANPPGDIKYISTSLMATMMKHFGIGLAANQCNLPYRMFVMGGGGYIETVINPEIYHVEGEDIDQEGCLSYTGVYLNIKRPLKIKVRYYNKNGELKDQTFEGLTARVFQHEFDHLQGTRFTEHVSSFEYQRAKGKAKQIIRKQKKALEQAKQQARRQEAMQRAVQQAPMTYSTDSESNLVIKSEDGPNLIIK